LFYLNRGLLRYFPAICLSGPARFLQMIAAEGELTFRKTGAVYELSAVLSTD
jgi:hypothetical protein